MNDAQATYHFVKTPYSRKREREAISVLRTGRIHLTQRFCDVHDVAQYGFVELAFDKERQLIALRLTNNRSPGARRLVLQTSGRAESAQGFFRWFGIDCNKHADAYKPTKRLSKDLGLDEPGYQFVIDLKQPLEVRTATGSK